MDFGVIFLVLVFGILVGYFLGYIVYDDGR